MRRKWLCSVLRFPQSWIQNACEKAYEGCIVNSEGHEEVKLVLIEGKFMGWTPLQLARRYVFPSFTGRDSPFASLTFVIADDESHKDGKESHKDGKLLLAAIDWKFFDKPGSPLRIEATMRVQFDMAIDLPIILHNDIQGVYNYPSELYDNEAEAADAFECSKL